MCVCWLNHKKKFQLKFLIVRDFFLCEIAAVEMKVKFVVLTSDSVYRGFEVLVLTSLALSWNTFCSILLYSPKAPMIPYLCFECSGILSVNCIRLPVRVFTHRFIRNGRAITGPFLYLIIFPKFLNLLLLVIYIVFKEYILSFSEDDFREHCSSSTILVTYLITLV